MSNVNEAVTKFLDVFPVAGWSCDETTPPYG